MGPKSIKRPKKKKKGIERRESCDELHFGGGKSYDVRCVGKQLPPRCFRALLRETATRVPSGLVSLLVGWLSSRSHRIVLLPYWKGNCEFQNVVFLSCLYV